MDEVIVLITPISSSHLYLWLGYKIPSPIQLGGGS